MIAEMLGFSREDQPMLSQLLSAFLVRYPNDPHMPPEALRAVSELGNYFNGVLMDRRRKLDRRDDLIDSILHAEVDGKRLPDEEILGIFFFLFVAGGETVSGLLTNALWLLEAYPDQRARLVTNLSEIPTAIEEVLRFESPLQNLMRTTTRDVEMHDRVIPEGARVALLYGSANRDERVFQEPDRFNVTRKIRRHLAFGDGIHHCIGAPLARLEGKLALRTLLSQVPDYTVAGPLEWTFKQNFRGLKSMPVTF